MLLIKTKLTLNEYMMFQKIYILNECFLWNFWKINVTFSWRY